MMFKFKSGSIPIPEVQNNYKYSNIHCYRKCSSKLCMLCFVVSYVIMY